MAPKVPEKVATIVQEQVPPIVLEKEKVPLKKMAPKVPEKFSTIVQEQVVPIVPEKEELPLKKMAPKVPEKVSTIIQEQVPPEKEEVPPKIAEKVPPKVPEKVSTIVQEKFPPEPEKGLSEDAPPKAPPKIPPKVPEKKHTASYRFVAATSTVSTAEPPEDKPTKAQEVSEPFSRFPDSKLSDQAVSIKVIPVTVEYQSITAPLITVRKVGTPSPSGEEPGEGLMAEMRLRSSPTVRSPLRSPIRSTADLGTVPFLTKTSPTARVVGYIVLGLALKTQTNSEARASQTLLICVVVLGCRLTQIPPAGICCRTSFLEQEPCFFPSSTFISPLVFGNAAALLLVATKGTAGSLFCTLAAAGYVGFIRKRVCL